VELLIETHLQQTAQQPGGTGNTPPVSPSQGFNGGNANNPWGNARGGGGGGATADGLSGCQFR